MTILYVFPHPDDESFGPARGMSKQLREGHQVHLLVLTKGEATRVRHTLGLSKEEMGEVRYREMLAMAKILGLSGMRVLDLPDGALKEIDPRVIEKVVIEEIERLRPDIVVTYPVHGNSGFHDHLVTHAVVKRGALETRERLGCPRRIAFYTLTAAEAAMTGHFKLHSSSDQEIDCLQEVDPEDIERNIRALDCYTSYQEIIEAVGIRDMLVPVIAYEFFGEGHDPALGDLCGGV